MAGAGGEVDARHKGALGETHDHDDAPGVNGDLTRTAGAREASLWIRVVTNHSRVQVTKAIDLRPAEQGDIDQAALEIQHEQVRHTDDGGRAAYQRGIADGEGQARRLRAENTAFIDQFHIR